MKSKLPKMMLILPVIVWVLTSCSLQQGIDSSDKTQESSLSGFINETDNAAAGSNLALGKTVSASSYASATYAPKKAVDGVTTSSRWVSASSSSPQWIYVNLGAVYNINKIVIKWYSKGYAKAYKIQVSSNAVDWTTLFSATANTLLTKTFSTSAKGQYVRIYATVRASTFQYYAINELQVFEGGSSTRPVDINGQLKVIGTSLCNKYGKAIQLRGMSTHGIQWHGDDITPSSLDVLANEWGADILRISMYVQEDGYETDPAGFKIKIDNIVDMVVARGMYAILDWHQLDPGDPNENITLAKEYFTYMTQKHGSKPNILYEICNEPSDVSWSSIRSYANQMVTLIRKYDPDGVILVGTPDWSSLGVSGEGSAVEDILSNPVNDTNIMYTFHMYTASHGYDYYDVFADACDQLPMFVTEWGTQTASGGGANDFTMAQEYLDLMSTKKISWTSWNYSDDPLSGAVFKTGTGPNGPWSGTAVLKNAGVWIRDKIMNPADNFPTN